MLLKRGLLTIFRKKVFKRKHNLAIELRDLCGLIAWLKKFFLVAPCEKDNPSIEQYYLQSLSVDYLELVVKKLESNLFFQVVLSD
jgi:hypothetical protein